MKTVSLSTVHTPDISEAAALALLGKSETLPRDTVSVSQLVSSCVSSEELPLHFILAAGAMIVFAAGEGAGSPNALDGIFSSFDPADYSIDLYAVAGAGSGRSRPLTFPNDTIVAPSYVTDGSPVLLSALAYASPKWSAAQVLQLIDDMLSNGDFGNPLRTLVSLDQVSGAIHVYTVNEDLDLAVLIPLSVGQVGWTLKYVFNLTQIADSGEPSSDFPVWG